MPGSRGKPNTSDAPDIPKVKYRTCTRTVDQPANSQFYKTGDIVIFTIIVNEEPTEDLGKDGFSVKYLYRLAEPRLRRKKTQKRVIWKEQYILNDHCQKDLKYSDILSVLQKTSVYRGGVYHYERYV